MTDPYESNAERDERTEPNFWAREMYGWSQPRRQMKPEAKAYMAWRRETGLLGIGSPAEYAAWCAFDHATQHEEDERRDREDWLARSKR